jgi:hypothetical protein
MLAGPIRGTALALHAASRHGTMQPEVSTKPRSTWPVGDHDTGMEMISGWKSMEIEHFWNRQSDPMSWSSFSLRFCFRGILDDRQRHRLHPHLQNEAPDRQTSLAETQRRQNRMLRNPETKTGFAQVICKNMWKEVLLYKTDHNCNRDASSDMQGLQSGDTGTL